MKLIIEIDMDHAAWEDDQDGELKRVFETVRTQISVGILSAGVKDINGNRSGRWEILG